MAQFRYRLERLLEQKVAAKDDAQQALADRQKELTIEREALEACAVERERIGTRLADLRRSMLAGVAAQQATGAMIGMRREFAIRLQQELREAQDSYRAQELRIRDAEDAVQDARKRLAECSREVETLEKHRDRLRAQFEKEAERKESLEQEEMGNVMFLRRRQGS
jgi:flagellar biosynthesis chaperone FliJ